MRGSVDGVANPVDVASRLWPLSDGQFHCRTAQEVLCICLRRCKNFRPHVGEALLKNTGKLP
jgi:hypothetical protein